MVSLISHVRDSSEYYQTWDKNVFYFVLFDLTQNIFFFFWNGQLSKSLILAFFLLIFFCTHFHPIFNLPSICCMLIYIFLFREWMVDLKYLYSDNKFCLIWHMAIIVEHYVKIQQSMNALWKSFTTARQKVSMQISHSLIWISIKYKSKYNRITGWRKTLEMFRYLTSFTFY